jgi:hypothetical protein
MDEAEASRRSGGEVREHLAADSVARTYSEDEVLQYTPLVSVASGCGIGNVARCGLSMPCNT